MTIYKKRKVLFLHIPRTGGTTIEHNLGNRNNNQLFGFYKNKWAKQHLTLEQLVKFNFLKENEIDDYFKFSFVRNPWDKLASSYRFKYHQLCNSYEDFLLRVKKIVQEFEETNDFITNKNTWNIQKNDRLNKSEVQLRPQYHFTHYKGEKISDFIGKFENYTTDIHKLGKKINLNFNLEKQWNKSGKKWINSNFYKNSKNVDLIYDIYEKDIEIFDFKYKK